MGSWFTRTLQVCLPQPSPLAYHQLSHHYTSVDFLWFIDAECYYWELIEYGRKVRTL